MLREGSSVDFRGALPALGGFPRIANVIFHFREDCERLPELWPALALEGANNLRQQLARSADPAGLDIKSRQTDLRIRSFLPIASDLAFL